MRHNCLVVIAGVVVKVAAMSVAVGSQGVCESQDNSENRYNLCVHMCVKYG